MTCGRPAGIGPRSERYWDERSPLVKRDMPICGSGSHPRTSRANLKGLTSLRRPAVNRYRTCRHCCSVKYLPCPGNRNRLDSLHHRGSQTRRDRASQRGNPIRRGGELFDPVAELLNLRTCCWQSGNESKTQERCNTLAGSSRFDAQSRKRQAAHLNIPPNNGPDACSGYFVLSTRSRSRCRSTPKS